METFGGGVVQVTVDTPSLVQDLGIEVAKATTSSQKKQKQKQGPRLESVRPPAGGESRTSPLPKSWRLWGIHETLSNVCTPMQLCLT